MIANKKMSAQKLWCSTGCIFDLNTNVLAYLGNIQGLMVIFDTRDTAQINKFLRDKFILKIETNIRAFKFIIPNLYLKKAKEITYVFALSFCTCFEAHCTHWTTDFEKSCGDLATDNDRVTGVKDEFGQNLELKGKHGNVFELFTFLCFKLISVTDKLVE